MPRLRGRGLAGDRPRRLPPGARFWPSFQEAVVANTNILLDDHVDSHGIHVDHAEQDPSRRFKMVLCMGAEWRKGLTPAVSADGLTWRVGTPYVIRGLGDRSAYWYHEERKTHVAWSRCLPVLEARVVMERQTRAFDTWGTWRRSISTSSGSTPS